MILKSNKVSSFFLYLAAFFIFSGAYIFILILTNFGMLALSRALTLPIRVLIILSLFIATSYNARIKAPMAVKYMLWFSFLYIFRMMVDMSENNRYHIAYSELLLYFLAFSFLPFLLTLRLKLKTENLTTMLNAIVLSSFFFSLLSIITYKKFIGSVGRLNSSATGEDVLSPLILSYCGALAIGVITAYLLNNKVTFLKRMYCFATIGLSVVPFFLGASRGSLFALFIPFLFIIFTKKRKGSANFKIIFVIILSVFLLFFIADKIGSNLVDRVTNIDKDVNQGNSAAVRTIIWKQTLTQFLNNPIAGDKFEINGFDGYPHNIFFETLQTTGILGAIPFLLLTINGFTASLKILKFAPMYSWVPVIFIQSFIQNMFSGAVYTASWFWFSLAVVICLNLSLKEKWKKPVKSFS